MDTNLTREAAIRFAMREIVRSTDWQEVENALANDTVFGPWLSGDATLPAQSIIREAEDRLGDQIPDGYSN